MDSFGDIILGRDEPRTGVRAGRSYLRPIPVALLSAVLVCAGVVAFERLGTVANADTVETTQNQTGGFLAVGMTARQPGFVLVSALEEKDVSLDTRRSVNKLAGTHTKLFVKTHSQTWQARLRKPLVITIDHDGTIRSSAVDWPVHTFRLVRDAVDCDQRSSTKPKHCGAPFLDLKERVAKWPPDTVPACLREFLASR